VFLGQYSHNLDYKGRLSVPKKFREQLGREAILTHGLEGCLFLYPKSSWEALTKKLAELPFTQADTRAFGRYLFGGATQVGFDSIGRIVVPDYLRAYSSLEKKVIFVGVLDRIEIWDKESWQRLEQKLAKSGEDVAERLSKSGI